MVKVKKLFGEFPESVAVLSEVIVFDAEGVTEVSEEVAEVLAQIPGYEVEDASEDEEATRLAAEALASEGANDVAPKKPAPKAKPAPKTE